MRLAYLFQFYNDLMVILSQFRDGCKEWVNLRRNEIRYVPASYPSEDNDLAGHGREHTSFAVPCPNSRQSIKKTVSKSITTRNYGIARHFDFTVLRCV